MYVGVPCTQFLQSEGGTVAFDDTGVGPLVICIPGMGDLRSQYRHLMPGLVRAGYRVVTMDVRGFGETSAEWSDYSARAVGRDAVAVLSKLDAGPSIIIGNSFAAGSALWAAKENPDRVKGVILLAPIVRDIPLTLMQRASLAIGFAKPWRVRFWIAYWSSLFPMQKSQDHAQVRAAIARNLKEPGRMHALMSMLSLSKADTTAILDHASVPALIVMGTKDPDFPDPFAEAKWLAKKLNAQTFMVDGVGHYPHVEMAAQVVSRIVDFLSETNLRYLDRSKLDYIRKKFSGLVLPEKGRTLPGSSG